MAWNREIPTVERLTELLSPALASGGAEKAIVFGSVATGKADEYSGVDLIVEADTERPFLQRHEDSRQLFKAWPRAIDLLIYTPAELAAMTDEERGFIMQALEEGVVIYERPGKGGGEGAEASGV